MAHLTDIKDTDLNIGDEIAVAFRRSTSVYMRIGNIVEFKEKPVQRYDWMTKQTTWATENKIVVKWTRGGGIPENPEKTSTIEYDSTRICKVG